MTCSLCQMERENTHSGWIGKDEFGDEIFICENCIDDYITEETEGIEGLYCSLCFDDIEDPEGTWIWKRSNDTCICPSCVKKGSFL